MKVVEKNGIIALYAEGTNKLTNKERSFYTNYIYLGNGDSVDNYEEVERDIWKNFVKVKDPDVIELQNRTDDIDEALIANDEVINSIMLVVDEIYNMTVDEIYNIAVNPVLLSEDENTTKIAKATSNALVNFYVLMVNRKLKDVEDIPEKYREEVRALINK